MFYQLFRIKLTRIKEQETNKKNGIGVLNLIDHPKRGTRDKHKVSLVSHIGEYYLYAMTWLLE